MWASSTTILPPAHPVEVRSSDSTGHELGDRRDDNLVTVVLSAFGRSPPHSRLIFRLAQGPRRATPLPSSAPPARTAPPSGRPTSTGDATSLSAIASTSAWTATRVLPAPVGSDSSPRALCSRDHLTDRRRRPLLEPVQLAERRWARESQLIRRAWVPAQPARPRESESSVTNLMAGRSPVRPARVGSRPRCSQGVPIDLERLDAERVERQLRGLDMVELAVALLDRVDSARWVSACAGCRPQSANARRSASSVRRPRAVFSRA